MALQVWLPLNGNMENQGLANVTITESGGSATYADGKIGLGLSTSSKFWVIRNITLGSEATIAYWSKTTVDSKMVWVLECDVSNYLNIYTRSIYTLNIGDGNDNPFKNNGSNVSVLNDGLWHHFAVTFGNSVAKLYIDGEYRGTALTFRSPATTNKPIKLAGGFNNAHSYDWNGMINDFRVYDNCLSAKEVRDLSQALILHYPLDKNNITFNEIGNENLFIGSTFNEIDRGTLATTSSTDYGQYVRYYNGAPSNHTFSSGDVAEDTILLNSKANIGVSFVRKASDISLDSSSYYTISCEAKCTKANAQLCIGLSYYNTSNTWIWRGGTNPQTFNAVNTWQYFTLTFKPDADTQYIQYCFTVNPGVAGGSDTFTLRKCKLEKGSVATQWSKSPHDSKTIFDCSGFGNDGITKGALNNSDISPRYERGTTFVNGCYIAANEKAKVKDEISVCCWAYMDNWSNYTSCMLLSCTQTGGWNFEVNSGKMTFLMGTGASSNTYKQAICTTALADLSSGWHYFVGTYDGFYVKIYVDGVLDGTVNAYTAKTPIFYNTANTIFIGAEAENTKIKPAVSNPYYFNGKISDVRIYATALSADDIIELYNTSAYICDSDRIKSYEFSECDYVNPGIDYHKIPDGCKEIEYIYSDYSRQFFITLPLSANSSDYLEVGGNVKIGSGSGQLFRASVNNQFQCTYSSNDASTNIDTFTTTIGGKTSNNVASGNISFPVSKKTFIAISTTFTQVNNTIVEISRPLTSSINSFRLFGGSETPSWAIRMYVYDFYIKKNDKIIYDLVPVRSGTTGYMFDRVTGQLFANSGTDSFVLGPDITKITEIPYQRIEYLESSGIQYIDLGLRATNNITIDAEIYRSANSVRFDCGAEDGWDAKIARFITIENSDTYWQYGNSSVPSTKITSSSNLVGKISININNAQCVLKNITSGNSYNAASGGNTPFTTTGTFLLFAYSYGNTPTVEQASSGCRIYSFKVTDTNVNMDLIPVRVGNIGYMYDTISGQLFANSGSGNFVVGPDIVSIEYLENTGNNFIATNYIPNSNNLIIKTKFYLSGYSSTVAWIAWFTGYSGEQNNTFRVIRFNTTNNSVYVNHNSKANNGGTQVSISGLNTLYDITLSHGKININGTETNISTASGNENTSPFTLFANGGVSTPTSFAYGRFYYFSVYDGNNLVLNLVPVRADNVGYMYDTVSEKLFGNSGSGSFVLGQDVNDDTYENTYQFVDIYKNGLVKSNEFSETSGSTTFGDSYVLSEEFVEI